MSETLQDIDLIKQLFRRNDRPMRAATRLRTRRLASRHFEAEAGPTLLQAGDQLGNYRIQRVLGSGDAAVVYLAAHRHLPARQVALKVPFGPDVPAMIRGVKELAGLKHPGIVDLLDIDPEHQTPFVVLEHCSEGSLADQLETGERLSEREVLRIARALLDALGYAHSQGFCHRNLQPSNILFDALARPRIADFGLGALAEAQLRARLSQAGLLGTLYLAPEQERADTPVDGRCDLYALGMLLYAMLTGNSPRTLRPVEREREALDPAWNEIILCLTETDPDQRYPDAAAVLRALDGLQNDRTRILARHPAEQEVPARLRMLEGEMTGQQFTLRATQRTRIGRRTSSTLRLGDPGVSGSHAEIRFDAGFVLHDLQSANGTFVNGDQVVTPVRLKHGDTIAFGAVRGRFELGKPARRSWLPRLAGSRVLARLLVGLLLVAGLGCVAWGLGSGPAPIVSYTAGGGALLMVAVLLLGRMQRWNPGGQAVVLTLLGGLALLVLSQLPGVDQLASQLGQNAGTALLGLGCLGWSLLGIWQRRPQAKPATSHSEDVARVLASARHAQRRKLPAGSVLAGMLFATGVLSLAARLAGASGSTFGLLGLGLLPAAIAWAGLRRWGALRMAGLTLAVAGIAFAVLPTAIQLPVLQPPWAELAGLLVYATSAGALLWQVLRSQVALERDIVVWIFGLLFFAVCLVVAAPFAGQHLAL